jgi:hypothetical protein
MSLCDLTLVNRESWMLLVVSTVLTRFTVATAENLQQRCRCVLWLPGAHSRRFLSATRGIR